MQEFVYQRPETLAAAVAALGEGDARVLAGGTDLVPQLREGRRQAARIIDLKFVPELTEIAATAEGGVAIGAAATAASVARHPLVAARYPAVAQSVQLIGGTQVQNRASLGGNICNAAPSADGVPALIAHAARAQIAGPAGRREMSVEAVFAGPGRTTLAPGELLVAIVLPLPAPRAAAAYLRFTPRREMDIAVAGAGAWIRLGADGAIAEARIALASVAPTPIRAPTAEAKLKGARPSAALFEAAGRRAAQDARPISDTRGSADYRRKLTAVLTARALSQCAAQLGSEVAVA
ncbi:MAG TPA: xanthine dehydrogenase family protein subunit M [Xanthobacteraceae bacterium]|nr:xanthine dehydrogenase family protein subunit M [Xanthobacteraceae bacterium]